jgi:hypothetical protein
MKDSVAVVGELDVPDHADVPEHVGSDPFEDAVTDEIVMLDVIRLDLAEVELL